MELRRSRGGWLATAAPSLLAGGLFFVVFLLVAINSNIYQWDFRIFHLAPNALTTGVDPYALGERGVGYPTGLSYLYPPSALYVFYPFSRMSWEVAYEVWLILKVCALALLLRIWHVHFEKLWGWTASLILMFACSSTLARDIGAGNISIFEQLALWIGFALLLKGRPYWAGLCIACIAQFKFLPAAFLILILLIGSPGRWRPFLVSLAIFMGLLALNPVLMPEMFDQYIQSFGTDNPNLDEPGSWNNWSSLALFRDLAHELKNLTGLDVGSREAAAVFAMCALGVWARVIYDVMRLRARCDSIENRRLILYVVCAAYAVTMPRFKDYAYILMLIPSLYAVRRLLTQRVSPVVLVPLLLPALVIQGLTKYVPKPLLSLLDTYASLLLSWIVLAYLLASIRSALQEPVASTATAAAPLAEPFPRAHSHAP